MPELPRALLLRRRVRLLSNNERLPEQPLIVVCKHKSDKGSSSHLLSAECTVTSLVLGLRSFASQHSFLRQKKMVQECTGNLL